MLSAIYVYGIRRSLGFWAVAGVVVWAAAVLKPAVAATQQIHPQVMISKSL